MQHNVTALATTNAAELAPATYFGETLSDLAEAMHANHAPGTTFRMADLDQIKVPGAGSLAWQIPIIGGSRTAEYVEGVILLRQDHRGFFERDYSQAVKDGGDLNPDCRSEDMINGSAPLHESERHAGIEFGGTCETCPMSAWTKQNGMNVPPPCKTRMRLFILTADQAMPIYLDVPPSSIPNMSAFFKALTKFGFPHYRVVTQFHIESATSQAPTGRKGIAYAKIAPKVLRNSDNSVFKLGVLESTQMASMRDQFAGLLRTAPAAPRTAPTPIRASVVMEHSGEADELPDQL